MMTCGEGPPINAGISPEALPEVPTRPTTNCGSAIGWLKFTSRSLAPVALTMPIASIGKPVLDKK